ncbi:hypothetical protein, partial [Klebsiella pneumoniae]|uniref:hypothetical protein n=1 Tax=Klebsiella pneumoniae TaxID=573 RepID=UPI0024DDFFDF
RRDTASIVEHSYPLFFALLPCLSSSVGMTNLNSIAYPYLFITLFDLVFLNPWGRSTLCSHLANIFRCFAYP